ncbi:MAG: hypothetical protein Q8P18_21380 [Pseudomonadota bacterium]|nr:hypothetical protein [Pseudomonadota bacterium]
MTGKLTDIHAPTAIDRSNTIALSVDGQPVRVDLFQVVSVHRVDEKRISVSTEGDYREQEVDERLTGGSTSARGERSARARGAGTGLVVGGVALLALGTASLLAFQGEATKGMDAALKGDIPGSASHGTAASTWSTVGAGAFAVGAPMFVGGIIVLSVGGRDDKSDRMPELDSLPDE